MHPFPVIPVADLTLPELADEYAITRLRMRAWRPEVNPDAQRFAELKTELLARHENEKADKRIIVEGTNYTVPISPREHKSTIIDPLKLYRKLVRRMGIARLIGEFYTITLTKARSLLLTESELEKFIRTERTGEREIGEPVVKA